MYICVRIRCSVFGSRKNVLVTLYCEFCVGIDRNGNLEEKKQEHYENAMKTKVLYCRTAADPFTD